MLISLNRGYRKVLLLESPELLAVVEAQKVGIIAEKFFKQRAFKPAIRIILEMALSAAGRLDQRPYVLFGTGAKPGFCKLVTVVYHAPGMSFMVIIYRH